MPWTFIPPPINPAYHHQPPVLYLPGQTLWLLRLVLSLLLVVWLSFLLAGTSRYGWQLSQAVCSATTPAQ
jgi:hypothetical protein